MWIAILACLGITVFIIYSLFRLLKKNIECTAIRSRYKNNKISKDQAIEAIIKFMSIEQKDGIVTIDFDKNRHDKGINLIKMLNNQDFDCIIVTLNDLSLKLKKHHDDFCQYGYKSRNTPIGQGTDYSMAQLEKKAGEEFRIVAIEYNKNLNLLKSN